MAATRPSSVPPPVELAREPLLSCGSLLVASLVPGGGCFMVELGRHPVTPRGVRPAYKPLRLAAPCLPRLRRLAEAALLNMATAASGGAALELLARDGELGATLSREPGEPAWFSLVLVDGSGIVALPAREASSLTRLVRDAERELSSRGLAALDPAVAH